MQFVVLREQGPGWDASRGMREQRSWPEHVEFINRVAEESFLLLAGPVGEGSPYRAMLVVDAVDPEEVVEHLEEDPWTKAGVLETCSIDRWDVLVGEFGPG